MVDPSKIQEHMHVHASDGKHVGTVDKVEGDRIKLTKNDPVAGGQHHYIPLSLVESADRMVKLNVPAEQARQQMTTA